MPIREDQKLGKVNLENLSNSSTFTIRCSCPSSGDTYYVGAVSHDGKVVWNNTLCIHKSPEKLLTQIQIFETLISLSHPHHKSWEVEIKGIL